MLNQFVNKNILGKKKYQKLFNKFYHYSKYGRNIGLPIEVATSGEEFIIKKISQHFDKEKQFIFLDIGANSGEYTEIVLKHFSLYKQLECHLFEPQIGLVQELNNKFKNLGNVFVQNFGLGNSEEMLKLYNFMGINTISSLYSEFKGEVISGNYVEIMIKKGENYLAANNKTEIDFIKIDVEGHELEVMKGLGNYLTDGRVKLIQFEFGSFNIASRTFFQDFWKLLSKNYRIYRMLKDGLWEIENYSIDLEIFDTTNYLSVRKDISINF